MSESGKKVLTNEELEDVNGGTIIDSVMDVMDVMDELGVGPDKSKRGKIVRSCYYVKDLNTNKLIGPFPNSKVANEEKWRLMSDGGSYRVIRVL